MYVKSVSWTTNNSKKKSNEHTKRYPMVYYLDESGHFGSFRISRFKIPFYKAKICKTKTFYCDKCEKKFTLLLKKNDIVTCPYCKES